MRVTKMAAQLFGGMAVAVGCLGLATTDAKAGDYHGGYRSHQGGYQPGYGGYRHGYGGYNTGRNGGYNSGWNGGYRPGGFIYNRPGDGLPPLPAHRVPGGI